MNKKQLKLATIYPFHVKNYGIGNAALKLTEHMNSDRISASFYCPASSKDVSTKFKTDIVPPFLKYFYYKFLTAGLQRSIERKLFLKKTEFADIIYIWPGVCPYIVKRIKSRGQKIVIENINCHQQTAKFILDNEYKSLEIDNSKPIRKIDIDMESELLSICDFVFSPSPQVTKSIEDSGIASNKIITTSYGLTQNEQIKNNSPKTDIFTAIFVGRVGVRKGVHLLLDYWIKADVPGILKVIGDIEPAFQQIADQYASHPRIEFITFTQNLAVQYQSADLFILPSLEEGSPLVTYQAIGAGLPALVSPMGGKGVIRHDVEGYIIEPHDEKNWIKYIRQVASSKALREKLSKASFERSDHFLWSNVGRKRADMLIAKLEGE